MGNADIGVLCGVSVRTVHKHVEHILDKLNVENRTAAVRKMRELSYDVFPVVARDDSCD
jgi:DNA-binding NarL/FixJ family response regulator